MKKEAFNELVASVREGGAILRGERRPARTRQLPPIDVKQLRSSYRMSQEEFALMLGISAKTLRNWEQGRRVPEGPARVLLQIAATNPDVIWNVVRSTAASGQRSVRSRQ